MNRETTVQDVLTWFHKRGVSDRALAGQRGAGEG